MAGVRLPEGEGGQRRLLRPERGPRQLPLLARRRSRHLLGDERLEDCAVRRRDKAGGATQWRAWATSHHLAVVTSRLVRDGVP
nr:hypothetical protein [Streptomyces albidoflavus]